MSAEARQRARAAFGAPVIPPGRATRALTRVRERVLGIHRGLAPPPVQILEGLFGLVDNRVLGMLVDLDLPEHLNGSRSVDDLALATATDAARLDRVLRYAAGRGFLRRDRRGRYRANAVTARLRRDHPNSWRGWVEFAGSSWWWDAWRHLPAALEPGGPSGLEAAVGEPFFAYVNTTNPHAGRAFNSAMEAGSAVQGLALASALEWDEVQTVCDVGGGTGAALESLLASVAHLTGTLFDLPEVVAEARPELTSGALNGRCQVVGGDFFEAVPSGADRYLLLAVVHDWDDEQAARILTTVREAMSPASDAVIVEWALPDRPSGDFAFTADLLMLAVAEGRERTHDEYTALFERAGLRLEERVWLASGAAAFVLRAV